MNPRVVDIFWKNAGTGGRDYKDLSLWEENEENEGSESRSPSLHEQFNNWCKAIVEVNALDADEEEEGSYQPPAVRNPHATRVYAAWGDGFFYPGVVACGAGKGLKCAAPDTTAGAQQEAEKQVRTAGWHVVRVRS